MLSDMEYEICRTQGMLYETAADQQYDIHDFSNQYMRSRFCNKRMDTLYSRYQMADPEEIMDFLDVQNVKKLNGYFDRNIAFWIGFTYRQLWFETAVASKNLVTIIPFQQMLAYYPGMHTIDEDQASEIIAQNHHLSIRKTDIQNQQIYG